MNEAKANTCEQDSDCGSTSYPTFCLDPHSGDVSTRPPEIAEFVEGFAGTSMIAYLGKQCVPWPVTGDRDRLFCHKDADCGGDNKCHNLFGKVEAALKAIASSTVLSAGWCYSPLAPSENVRAQRDAAQIELIKPRLEIPLPFVNMTAPVVADANVTIPFLAQYIAGVYKFLLSIVGVLATVMLMVGGFQYLTAGGDKNRVEAGRKRILNALIGLVLAFGSYTMLWAINPALVRFEAFQIMGIAPDPTIKAETAIYDTDKEGGDLADPAAQPLGDGDLDKLFTTYATCLGIEPGTLKAVAYAESGLDPAGRTRDGCTDEPGRNCFVGLFQLYKDYCEDRIKDIDKAGIKYLQEILQSKSDCTVANRLIPEVNVALYTLKNMQQIEDIRSACGTNISLKDFIMTLYVHHNNGPGIGKDVLRYGSDGACVYAGTAMTATACNAETANQTGLRKYVRLAYEAPGKGTTNAINRAASQKVCSLERLRKHGPADANDDTRWRGSCITADYGEKKMCHALNIYRAALRYGAINAFVARDLNTCPLTAGAKDKWVLAKPTQQ